MPQELSAELYSILLPHSRLHPRIDVNGRWPPTPPPSARLALPDDQLYGRMWAGIQASGRPMVLTVEGNPGAFLDLCSCGVLTLLTDP